MESNLQKKKEKEKEKKADNNRFKPISLDFLT